MPTWTRALTRNIDTQARKLVKTVGALAAAGAVEKGISGMMNKPTTKSLPFKRLRLRGGNEPVRSRKRVRTLGHGTAWKKVKRVRATRHVPKVGRKFKKKVDKVLNYEKPFGEYRYIADQQLRQVDKDLYTVYDKDNNQVDFDFFSPMRVWDAASICFNQKLATANSCFTTVANGQGTNVRPHQTIHVANSYVEMEFKSTSSHVVNLEMYCCYPKSNQPDLPSPWTNITAQTDMQGDTLYYLDNAGNVQQSSVDFHRHIGTKNGDWSILHKNYRVVKVTFKFNPGEHKRHFLQGPKNFSIDGTKYLNLVGNSAQANYGATAKFTCRLFFRVINDVTVSGQSDNAWRGHCGQWPSNNIGGIALRYTYTTRTRLPEFTDAVGANTTVFNDNLAHSRRNWIVIGNWTKKSEHDEDQQVLVENPIAVSSNSG
jgi:hypothetical protein